MDWLKIKHWYTKEGRKQHVQAERRVREDRVRYYGCYANHGIEVLFHKEKRL